MTHFKYFFLQIDFLESRLAKTFVDTLIELKFSDAPIISKNNHNANGCKIDKGKCIVCGSNQDWKDILKLEISKENNSKAKTLKDIQVASSKLGFGSYSKFLEKCDHEQLLTEININPLKNSTQRNKSPSNFNQKNALSSLQNEKKYLRNSTSSTYYANAVNSGSTTKNNFKQTMSNLIPNEVNNNHLPILNFSGNSYFTPTNESLKFSSTNGINNNISSDEKLNGLKTKFQSIGKYKKNQKSFTNQENDSNLLIKENSYN
jgi:hypothetical protein